MLYNFELNNEENAPKIWFIVGGAGKNLVSDDSSQIDGKNSLLMHVTL